MTSVRGKKGVGITDEGFACDRCAEETSETSHVQVSCADLSYIMSAIHRLKKTRVTLACTCVVIGMAVHFFATGVPLTL